MRRRTRAVPGTRRPPREQLASEESGTITPLVLGMTIIAITLVFGIVGATSAHLSRMRLLDAADAAALNASDEVSSASLYDTGVGSALPVSDEAVRSSAASYLARRPRPPRMRQWRVAPGTGAVDGTTAVVVLEGDAELPLVGSALKGIGGTVRITVESRARSDVG